MKNKPHLVEVNNTKGAFQFFWFASAEIANAFILKLEKESDLKAYYRGDFTELLK